uniref:CUB domain-containing protein n=1 Tax=Strigamia maritima TaxID=126957 RepID=T1J871_STRMM
MRRKTSPRDAVQLLVSQENPCYNFTVGNPYLQEIYSPKYPRSYPNNTNCECLLKAPSEMVIEIDFKDKFEMEESFNCTHDILEVRDGRGGHAPLLQRLCGMKFPARLRSAGEYMWLRFQSDESLEYGGFRAFYTFYDRSCCDPVTEFDCRDTTCINISLKCNNRINCKYKTDEENCEVAETKSILENSDVMAILILGLILLFSICISMTVSCYRQWKEIQKRRQELAARRSVISGIDRVDTFQPEGMTNVSVEPDDNGCYVPEVDLSIFHKRSNGGNAILFDQETALLDKQPPVSSLRQESGKRPSVTPPLIHRPSVATIDSLQLNNRTNMQSNAILVEEDDEAQDIFPPPPTRLQEIPDVRRYRVDANIHMKPNQRQRSFDSGKSAPDVIGRH